MRSHWRSWLGVLAATAAALVALAPWLRMAGGYTTFMRDDAFYEFTWAVNLASGHGAAVSADLTTSGVQYLWSLLLAGASRLFLPQSGWPEGLPATASALGIACHVLAAGALLAAGRGRAAALAVAVLWLGNPLLLRECANGQETALATLLLLSCWLTRRRPRWCGFLGMLAVLARCDLMLATAALAVFGTGGAVWRRLGWPLGALALHLALNRSLGGGWLQDSGAPMMWLSHASFAATEPSLWGWLRREWWFTRPVLLGGPFTLVSVGGLGAAVFLLLRAHWPRRWRAVPLFAVFAAALLDVHDLATAACAAMLLAWLPGRTSGSPAGSPLRRQPRAFTGLCLGLFAMLVLHWAVRWYPRDYYAAVLAVPAYAALLALRRLWWLLCVAAALQAVQAVQLEREPFEGQEEMMMAGRFVREVAPIGATNRVGCFNSGLVGWYSARTSRDHAFVLGHAGEDVINLDGVVDHRSLAAQRAHRLDAYLDEQQVTFLLDNPLQFERRRGILHACGPWFGPDFDAERDLVEVARFDVPGIGYPGYDSFRLYWRRARGAMPARPTAARELGEAADGGIYALWPARAGQALEVERSDGGRELLVEARVDTSWVVKVARARLGSGRLFVRGEPEPVLRLSPR